MNFQPRSNTENDLCWKCMFIYISWRKNLKLSNLIMIITRVIVQVIRLRRVYLPLQSRHCDVVPWTPAHEPESTELTQERPGRSAIGDPVTPPYFLYRPY
jgi:hypothetical protein